MKDIVIPREISANDFIEHQRKIHIKEIKTYERSIKSLFNSKEFTIILNMKKNAEISMIVDYMKLFSDLDVMPLFDMWSLDLCCKNFNNFIVNELKK